MAILFPVRQMMRPILMNNKDDCRTICSAAIPFPVWQNPAKYHNKDDFWKPVVNCRTGKGNTKPNLSRTFLFMCFYCFSSVSCDLSERQQGNLYILWLLESSETSREYLSSAGFTVGSSRYSHHTGALCIRQVIVVVIFLLLPELWPLGSFLFAHVSLA